MSDKQPLDSALDRWKDEFRRDPNLAARVRARASRSDERRLPLERSLAAWVGSVFARPGLAACFAGAFVLVGMGVSSLIELGRGFGRESEAATFSYRLTIDPLYRLQAMAGAREFTDTSIADGRESERKAPVLSAGLNWLQGQLKLTEAQYRQVADLHARYELEFGVLFSDLLESHQAYQGFDRRRMDSDVIDYFQLFELLQRQEALSEESTRLTRELLAEVEKLMEPSQRERYRKLLDSVYPEGAGIGANATDA